MDYNYVNGLLSFRVLHRSEIDVFKPIYGKFVKIIDWMGFFKREFQLFRLLHTVRIVEIETIIPTCPGEEPQWSRCVFKNILRTVSSGFSFWNRQVRGLSEDVPGIAFNGRLALMWFLNFNISKSTKNYYPPPPFDGKPRYSHGHMRPEKRLYPFLHPNRSVLRKTKKCLV